MLLGIDSTHCLIVITSLNRNDSLQVQQNGLLRTQWFAPPKKAGQPIETRKGERDQLKLSDSEPLNTPHPALNEEPHCVGDGDGFEKEITLRPVVYLGRSCSGKGDDGLVDESFKAIEGKCARGFVQVGNWVRELESVFFVTFIIFLVLILELAFVDGTGVSVNTTAFLDLFPVRPKLSSTLLVASHLFAIEIPVNVPLGLLRLSGNCEVRYCGNLQYFILCYVAKCEATHSQKVSVSPRPLVI